MKLKNKYSKQNIYSNQKLRIKFDIIMIFLNFSQLLESVFRSNFSGKHFLKTKPNFSLTGKCFPLTNFSNGKQTQENLKSNFLKITFQKTNTTKREITFL